VYRPAFQLHICSDTASTDVQDNIVRRGHFTVEYGKWRSMGEKVTKEMKRREGTCCDRNNEKPAYGCGAVLWQQCGALCTCCEDDRQVYS